MQWFAGWNGIVVQWFELLLEMPPFQIFHIRVLVLSQLFFLLKIQLAANELRNQWIISQGLELLWPMWEIWLEVQGTIPGPVGCSHLAMNQQMEDCFFSLSVFFPPSVTLPFKQVKCIKKSFLKSLSSPSPLIILEKKKDFTCTNLSNQKERRKDVMS